MLIMLFTRKFQLAPAAASLLAAAAVNLNLSTAQAQGTAFTYQGALNAGSAPANGTYDFSFTLFSTNTAGFPSAGPVINNGTAVSNGLFTTTVDFGAGIFTGTTSNWLEIGVRTNHSGGFSTLAPRQLVTPTPYAITASTASFLAGVLAYNTIGSGLYATVGGGDDNSAILNYYTTVSGGVANLAEQYCATVGGGFYNTNAGEFSTIAGGADNFVNNRSSTIAGGEDNTADNEDAAVAGGSQNTASGYIATVGGGTGNTASGSYSTVPGGSDNNALGDFSFAAGQNASAYFNGSFVWADDSTSTIFSDTAANQFCIRSAGGVFVNVSGSYGLNPAALKVSSTSANGVGLYIAEGSTDAGLVIANTGSGDILKGFSGGTGGNLVFEVKNNGTVNVNGVALTSDRNAKENFAAVDSEGVLAKVTALPITEWNYKFNSSEVRHVGPVAQDFHAAFGLDGPDDKHISVVDEGGVALAAIQGLNQKLEARLRENDAVIQSLEQRLERLEKMMSTGAPGAQP